MPQPSLNQNNNLFFSESRHPYRVYKWVHTNFSEDGYAYFISLGIEPMDAIHLASTPINAFSFQQEAQKASAAFSTEPEIKQAQLDYLRKKIKELTIRGGWKDDLQHSIKMIAEAINTGKPWGDILQESQKIGKGELFVYLTAAKYANQLKRMKEEQLANQNVVLETYNSINFLNNEYPTQTEMNNVCVIL